MLANLCLLLKFGQTVTDQNYFIKQRAQVIRLICLLAIGGILVSCGKRRPPVPPTRAVAGNYLSAAQRGNTVLLKITIPPQTRDIKQISIYRLNESLNSQAPLSEDDFASKSTLIGVAAALSDNRSGTVYYNDQLSNSAPANRLRYAVRLVFADGRRSALSNYLMIEPTFRIPLPPVLAPLRVSQSAIQLEWQKPDANLDSSKPANVVGYNIYRVQEATTASAPPPSPQQLTFQLLNSAPVTEASFNDSTFQFGNSYRYFIRAVSSSSSGNAAGNSQIESQDSNVQTVVPQDTFAPAAPQSLTIAAAPGRLSLFFAANAESDLAGYLVYRSVEQNIPLAQWPILTPNLLTTNTFQDAAIESGQKYFYYLRAVDKTGNISEPSETASETAP